MKVSIYSHTTLKSPNSRSGHCIYVIETKDLPYITGKNPLTESGPITDVSVNEAQLITLLRALKRLKASSNAEIEINTETYYIQSGIRRIEDYRTSGWITSKGKPVKYREIWEQIAAILGKQGLFSVVYAPVNEWSAWMETETDRQERKKKDGKN